MPRQPAILPGLTPYLLGDAIPTSLAPFGILPSTEGFRGSAQSGRDSWGISRYRRYRLVAPSPSLASSSVVGLLHARPSLLTFGFIDAAAANASMCPTANGSGGLQLEKFPPAPPSIEITAPEDVPDAGLRSLDHCKHLSGLTSARFPSS